MFSDPQKNVERFHLNLGDVVVDLGSGAGHYALAAMRAVGEKGKVYAVDINKDMLVRLSNEVKKQGFGNVEIVWGDVEKLGGTRLADGIADDVIISNLLFQLDSKESALAEAKRILKDDGKLFLIDWKESFGGLGPHADHVVTKDQAIALAEKAGLTKVGEFDAGAHHYGILFGITSPLHV